MRGSGRELGAAEDGWGKEGRVPVGWEVLTSSSTSGRHDSVLPVSRSMKEMTEVGDGDRPLFTM